VDLLGLARDPHTPAAELADAVAWCAEVSALPAMLLLVAHPDTAVRRSVAQALPRLAGVPRPGAVVAALITLSRDPVAEVRDWACYALGTRLSDVDSQPVRDALAARLADADPHVCCEALLGLARRRDPRALPAVRGRLAGEHVRLSEILAAGALGDPSLHVLVRAHLAGWGPEAVPRVCAALRLTDPDGVGDDLLDGLAEWYADRADGVALADRYWWSIALNLLEQAEHRAVEIAEAVHGRLRHNPDATARLLASKLAAIASAHGWLPDGA
jgi:HEAT repeat protein